MLKYHSFKLDYEFHNLKTSALSEKICHKGICNLRTQSSADFCVRRQNNLSVKGRQSLKEIPLVCSDAILGRSNTRDINDAGVFHSRHSVSLMIHQSIFI